MKFFRNIFPSKFSPYILFILAISIPITIIAISSGKFFLQNRAQEIDIPLNSTDILNSSDYIPGEVIMKLKQPLSTIQSKPIIRATNLKNLNKNSPSIFSNLHIIAKMLLFEKNRPEKIKMILKGGLDALRGKSGKLQ